MDSVVFDYIACLRSNGKRGLFDSLIDNAARRSDSVDVYIDPELHCPHMP